MIRRLMIAASVAVVATAAAIILLGSASAETDLSDRSDLAGRYVGYSWDDEATGAQFEESSRYIETILELDENGTITDAEMRFWVQKDGYWTTRQSQHTYVDVDFTVEPTPATTGDGYERGDAMFTTDSVDMMSLYAVAVSEDGTVAAAIVDPITRYRMEYKFASDYDFATQMSELTIGSGEMVPTVRTSSSRGPETWDDMADKHIFNISFWSHVVNDVGVLQDVDGSSSVEEFLRAVGVSFEGGEPQPMEVTYGHFGLGGWTGNYDAIESYVEGRDAAEFTSLIDWTREQYAAAVNEDNQFGVDVPSSATRTVQNSTDGISGATVRVSRESTSYQRALVQAGILEPDEVIIGRF